MFRLPTFRDAHRLGPCLALGGALALAACASEPEPPSFGERLSAEGSEVAELGAQWTQGEALIAEGRALVEDGRDKIDAGERLVSKGEKRMKTGRREVDRGEDLIARGKRLKREAEQVYGERAGEPAEG